MDWISTLLDWGTPFVVTLIIVSALIWVLSRVLPDEHDTRVYRQLAIFFVMLMLMVVLALVLPFSNETQGQLLSLFGLVTTAVIALASTTFVSNAMAGFMLRSVGSFNDGDFIRIGEHFGRVTETALLHTEIQSEDRDLVTLPNLFVITQPVRVVRSSGTLVSADISLGYDIHRQRVRELLKAAAEDAELADAFVQITELGDYSISYRISGFLEDVRNLVSKRTDLRARMLDQLHGANIEIVSPNFMVQRPVDPNVAVLPKRRLPKPDDDQPDQPEKLMFDKAELAGRIEKLRVQRDMLVEELKTLEGGEPAAQEHEIAWQRQQIDSLNDIIAAMRSSEPE